MRRDVFRSVTNEPISIEWSPRKEWSAGEGSGEGFIESVVMTGKWSDGEQWDEERDGESEQSENVMFVAGRKDNVLSNFERGEKT